MVKNMPAMRGDLCSVPRLGRSHGGGNGNPLQYSCLEISWPEEPGSHGVVEEGARGDGRCFRSSVVLEIMLQ